MSALIRKGRHEHKKKGCSCGWEGNYSKWLEHVGDGNTGKEGLSYTIMEVRARLSILSSLLKDMPCFGPPEISEERRAQYKNDMFSMKTNLCKWLDFIAGIPENNET